jgi:hypothetical protein
MSTENEETKSNTKQKWTYHKRGTRFLQQASNDKWLLIDSNIINVVQVALMMLVVFSKQTLYYKEEDSQ